ncbi:MAG: phosphatidylserine decarboxylase [Alphaproteobacteria bacterium]|nr:phosphatidylserine decarboxylase [Alphaproteobacteria bacterium]
MKIKLPYFDRDGWRAAFVIWLVAFVIGHVSEPVWWIGVAIGFACLLFFRDPERIPPSKNHVVVSPADGIILKIADVEPPSELGLTGQRKKISIFMSVLNVHVNRTPIAGTVEKIIYTPGRFFNVTLDKANEYNERQATFVRNDDGMKLVFVQIAGLIARRIRCDIKEGDKLERGQRVGIIRFGSRVDVYLPLDVSVLVEEGQITVAGETILANYNVEEKKNEKKPRNK